MGKRNPYHVPAGSPEGGQFTTGDKFMNSVREGAGLNVYVVPSRPNAKDIDFSEAREVVRVDNSKEKPKVIKKALPAIKGASDIDKEILKKIAQDEKEFYDNPLSTGVEEHTEIRLEKVSAGYQLRYTTFDTFTKEILHDYWEDFCRCPACKYPTITPDFEKAWNMCSTCSIVFLEEE